MEKEQYDIMRRVEDSHWWYVGMREITRGLLRDVGAKGADLRILDAGCGTGATLDFLSDRGAVIGIDVSSEGLRHCLARGHRHLSFGTIEQLPFRSDCFDLVTCFDVIYHRAVGDDVRALREFYRVLRPGGSLVVRAPAYNWLRGAHDEAVHTRHRYTSPEMRDKLEMAGFQTQRVSYANCFLLPLAILKRVLESRGAVFPPDLNQPRPLPNKILALLLKLEGFVMRRADLPWGLSVVAVGVKGCIANEGVSGSLHRWSSR